MKTLMHITRFSFVLLLFATVGACKKDKSDAAGAKGSYTFEGKTITTTRADYLSSKGGNAAGDVFNVYIYGQEATDIVQLIFPGASMPASGTYQYAPNAAPQDPKNPFFRGGTITSAAHPASIGFNAGTVTIAKNGDEYTLSFNVDTYAGKVAGSYTGILVSR